MQQISHTRFLVFCVNFTRFPDFSNDNFARFPDFLNDDFARFPDFCNDKAMYARGFVIPAVLLA